MLNTNLVFEQPKRGIIMSIKIFTDAASNLFPSILKEKGSSISVLPMAIDVGDTHFLCYEDNIDVDEVSKSFYEKVEKGEKVHTSLANPGLFKEKAMEEIKEGNQVIFVTLASGISGTYQSACLMANEINEAEGKEVVKVIDSKTASFGEAMIALKAEELSKDGLSFEEVINETVEYVSKVRSEFTDGAIKYLVATGRVSGFAAAIGDVLAIKPLLYGSEEAKIVVTSKVPGRKAALKRLANQVLDNIKDKNSLVYIAHANALEDVSFFKKILKDGGINNIETYYYDLVTGGHVGPGTIAVFYEGYNRDIHKKNVLTSILPKKKD